MEETAKEKTRLLSPKIDSVFQVLFGEVGRRRNFRCRFK